VELEKALLADVERYTKIVQDINQNSIDLESLKEEIAQAEEIAKKATMEAQMMEIERNTPPRVQKLEEQAVVRKLR
jgi:succinoglycan biosynthesis transport protein ExoP